MRSFGISSGWVAVWRRAVAAAAVLAALLGHGARATERAIRAEDALVDVQALAAPALEGRGALTPGLGEASRYVARRFAAAGLAPAGDGGTFLQAVEIPLPRRPARETRLELGGEALKLGVDFSPGVGAPATQALGPIAFVGRGGLADYAGLDTRGKLVICLAEGPPVGHKLENAIARGAVAVLVIDDAPASDLAPLWAFGQAGASAIPSFRVRGAAVDRLLVRARKSLAALRAPIEPGGRLASFDLGVSGAFSVAWVVPAVRGWNIVAMIPGADAAVAGEAVLLGAHYDHVGRGDEGGALDGPGLHPGADDNASGIAALLEAAEALAGDGPRPRRTILFVAFTGEERGLVGSIAAASHAPRSVVAMVNFDMVGRMRDQKLEIQGAPTSPVWREIVEGANSEHLALAFPPRVTRNSDHAPFIAAGVPALLLHTGMHADYHRRGDTPDKINADGIASTARLAARVARSVADRSGRLTFVGPTWTTAQAGAGGAP
jgi:hypothetical protein